jgi:hypothetical protein
LELSGIADATRCGGGSGSSCAAAGVGFTPWGKVKKYISLVKAARKARVGKAATGLPKLTGTIAKSFEGGIYSAKTFKAGTTFYRAEPWDASGPGRFLGTQAIESRAEADAAYNLAKWGNPAQVMRTYTLTKAVTLYYGRVAGGEGYQALIPKGLDPLSVLRAKGARPLR